MQPDQQNGKVILAGAGPGDPELVTMKTVRYLQQADIILTDRLVSDEILNKYANKEAEIIYVGKQCRRGLSTPQETINELMVAFAREGKLVLRLKGGDVSIFSNLLDELKTLAAHNIPYEIIPGVTAALGAAAYSGIPLTAREHATAVRFLTFYKSDIVTEEYWKELAETNDTLVFYMSSETLDDVVAHLVRKGISLERRIAVVEQATTPYQHVYITDPYSYDRHLRGKRFISPSIVIIGKVVSLNEQFGWVRNSEVREYYFKPVAKLTDDNETKMNERVSRA